LHQQSAPFPHLAVLGKIANYSQQQGGVERVLPKNMTGIMEDDFVPI